MAINTSMLISELLTEADDKKRAPYGVIFDGDNKAYVGSAHGKLITMSKDLKDRIMEIVEEHGIWYEGTGGDASTHRAFFGFGKTGYKDSWDDVFERNVGGYPHQYLYTIVSNTKVNEQLKTLTKPSMTIFDSIMKAQDKVGYFKDGRKFSKLVLTRFLKAISEGKHDFVEMGELKATKANVKRFLDAGEKLMWPSDWEEYPKRAGKLAKLANDERNKWLLKQKSGVYVMGSGHLFDLKRLKSTLKIVDGDRAKNG